MWGVSLTCLCCFMLEVSLTRPVLFDVGSFFYTPLAVLCGVFLLHAPAVLCGEFLLHAPAVVVVVVFWGVSPTHPLLFYVGSSPYTPLAALFGKFLLHAPCCFMWGVSLTRPLLFYMGSLSYTPCAVGCGEFLLHTSFCFIWGVSLTRNLLFYVGSFSYTTCAVWCGEVFLQAPHFCVQKVDKPVQEQGVLGEVCVPCLRSSRRQLSSNDTANEPNGSSQSITDWTDRPGFHGVAIGICLWLTQLVWIRLGTDRQRLRANTTSVPTPSVTGFCFTSLVFFSFFLSFTFTSDGLIAITVSAGIYVHIVYSIPNLNGWLDGWMSGFLLISSRLSLAQTMPPYMHRFCCSHCTALCGVFVYYMLNGAVR